MNIPTMLIMTLSVALCGNIAKKYYTTRRAKGLSAGFVYHTVVGATAAIVLLCWGGFGAVSVYTAVLGAIFGAITALQGIVNIGALQIGPMSYTSVITSFSTLISALSGYVFFDESLGWAQIVGIALVLTSFVLAAKSDNAEKKANTKWLLLCLIAFAATGAIGIMQKIHQNSPHKNELNAFLIIAFITSATICAVFSLWLKKKEKGARTAQDETHHAQKQFWLLLGVMLVGGSCVAVNNKLNLYLSGVVDSAIFFPVVNGCGLILTTLAAVIIFKEKLSLKQWIGLAIGIISVVFLCNPFQ